MKLSKRRKVCVAVLALGLVALVLDRTVLGPAEGAGSEAVPGEALPAAHASLIGTDAFDRGLAVISVGERLEQFRNTREGAGIADAFAAVGGWFEKAAQKQAPKPAPQPVDYKLTGMTDQMARINGKTMAVGEEIDGVRLISIRKDDRTAVIETDGQRIELRVAAPENELQRK